VVLPAEAVVVVLPLAVPVPVTVPPVVVPALPVAAVAADGDALPAVPGAEAALVLVPASAVAAVGLPADAVVAPPPPPQPARASAAAVPHTIQASSRCFFCRVISNRLEFNKRARILSGMPLFTDVTICKDCGPSVSSAVPGCGRCHAFAVELTRRCFAGV